MKTYRKAIVLRTNADHIKVFGAKAFEGSFKCGLTSDAQIIAYFRQKMSEERVSYTEQDYVIQLSTITVDA